MPIPRADSTASGSTPSTATNAFVTIGGTASTTSANTTFAIPMPKIASPNATTAMLGRARPTLPRLIARNEPRWRCPSTIPSGSPISSAMTIAITDSSRCSSVFSTISPGLSPTKRTPSTNTPGWKVSAITRASSPGPTA